MIPDESAEQLLGEMWNNFAVFSHENFLLSGRGVIGLNLPTNGESLDDVEVMYIVYDEEAGALDVEVAKMLRDYDPRKEMLFQYLQTSGAIRTIRVKAPNQDLEPETLWLLQSFNSESPEETNQR